MSNEYKCGQRYNGIIAWLETQLWVWDLSVATYQRPFAGTQLYFLSTLSMALITLSKTSITVSLIAVVSMLNEGNDLKV